MSRLVVGYNALLRRHPLLVPIVSTSALFGTGDAIAQQLIERRGTDHDFLRTVRLAAYGGLMFDFLFLDRIPLKSKPARVFSRVILDQFAFSPVIIPVFFTATTFMEGKSNTDVRRKIETSYKSTLLANWALFIPFQTINMFIPPQHRLLAVNLIALLWNTYLSLAASSSRAAPGIAGTD
ncbi:hypothetical protein BS47DRAFT_1370936 [Hydnum rufescens UP504]|uniref:Uncharacterized protein n=1 Tax=Hydnum rufescens UP504 TaxID=1448309 RepID=A0A9P6B742_9AGAM|nr:hypothetical protein BS47DRAFT_1370936 [Hydnum rufescens UP504]